MPWPTGKNHCINRTIDMNDKDIIVALQKGGY